MMQTQSYVVEHLYYLVQQYLIDNRWVQIAELAESVLIHRLLITPANLDSDII